MTSDYCTKDLSISNVLNMKIYGDASLTSTDPAIPVTVDTVLKYNYDSAGNYK